MPKTDLYPEDFYMSPFFVLERFKRIIEKHGVGRALTDNKFKAEREAWVTATFLLGFQTVFPDDYWVGINPDDSTPDTYGIKFAKLPKGLERQIMNFEIFEWERHSKESLAEAVLTKLKDKSYPNYYWLLCYGHSREGEKIEFEEVYRALQKENLKVGSVWFLSSVLSDDPGNHIVAQLYPSRTQAKFNYLKEAEKKQSQKEMIKILGRGTGIDFMNLGIKELPIL